jgi:hypothetical protein
LLTADRLAAPSSPVTTADPLKSAGTPGAAFTSGSADPPAGTVIGTGSVRVPLSPTHWTSALAAAVPLLKTWIPVVYPARWPTGTNTFAPSDGVPAWRAGTVRPDPFSSAEVPSGRQALLRPRALPVTTVPGVIGRSARNPCLPCALVVWSAANCPSDSTGWSPGGSMDSSTMTVPSGQLSSAAQPRTEVSLMPSISPTGRAPGLPGGRVVDVVVVEPGGGTGSAAGGVT